MAKLVVSDLHAALALAKDYDDALGFVIAPLRTRAGGARSWHALGPGDRWIPENDEGSELPSLPDPENPEGERYPPLPDSPINVWAFIFVDSRGKVIKPEILIDPSAEQPQAVPQPEIPQASPSPPPRPRPAPADLNGTVIEALRGSQEDLRALLGDVRGLLREVAAAGQVAAQGQRELKDEWRRMAQEERALREKLLAANTSLNNALVDAQANGQFWRTVSDVYSGKPEQFTGGVKDLLMGLVAAVKNAA